MVNANIIITSIKLGMQIIRRKFQLIEQYGAVQVYALNKLLQEPSFTT